MAKHPQGYVPAAAMLGTAPLSQYPRNQNFLRFITRPDGTTPNSWADLTCGHCGREVVAGVVAEYVNVRWLLCVSCQLPSVVTPSAQFPGAKFGPAIHGLPDAVALAYEEARNCLSVNAHAAAEMVCRQILAHTAVDKGAKLDLKFFQYVDYLVEKGFVLESMKSWVNQIKDNGNQTTHELPTVDRARAESTVSLTAYLLKLVYEMEHLAKQNSPPKP